MAYIFRGINREEPAYMSEPLPVSTKCGTRAGYRWHQNHGEPGCPECVTANNDYMRDYYRRKAAA